LKLCQKLWHYKLIEREETSWQVSVFVQAVNSYFNSLTSVPVWCKIFKESFIILHFTCQAIFIKIVLFVITWYNKLPSWRHLFRCDTSACRLIHRSTLYSSPVSLSRHFSINDKNFPSSPSRTMTSAVDWLQLEGRDSIPGRIRNSSTLQTVLTDWGPTSYQFEWCKAVGSGRPTLMPI